MTFSEGGSPRRQPPLDVPLSVVVLVGVLLLAHLVRVLLPPGPSLSILMTYALIPARYAAHAWALSGRPPVSFWDAAAPAVGYMFLHADWVHVGVNSLWLVIAGTPVARRLGTPRFFLLFFATGIAAAAAYVAANWGAYAPAIGASGAVSGLMGAAIRIFYGQQMVTGDAQIAPAPVSNPPALAPLFGGPILVFSAVWCIANIVAGITGLGTGSTTQAVAWEAHIGGYFAGLILIGPFDAFTRRNPNPVAT